MRNAGIFVAVLATLGVGLQLSGARDPFAGGASAKAKVKYADVQKIFTTSCVRCHGAAGPRGGIDLTKYESVMKGGEEGPIVKAGSAKDSVLYKAVAAVAGTRPMPPRGPKLADKDIKTIESWINQGAKK